MGSLSRLLGAGPRYSTKNVHNVHNTGLGNPAAGHSDGGGDGKGEDGVFLAKSSAVSVQKGESGDLVVPVQQYRT